VLSGRKSKSGRWRWCRWYDFFNFEIL